MGRGSRASCVTMNTGIPYGGGSPHGSNPTSNIRFPISTAPVDSNISSTIAASVSVLASNCQSLSRPGSFPSNGVPTLALGSVMKPSSDIETWDVTLLMSSSSCASSASLLSDGPRSGTHRSAESGIGAVCRSSALRSVIHLRPLRSRAVSGSWPRTRPGTRSRGLLHWLNSWREGAIHRRRVSDNEGQFGEGIGETEGRTHIGPEIVEAPAEVLDESMASDDHPGGTVTLQPAHRAKS